MLLCYYYSTKRVRCSIVFSFVIILLALIFILYILARKFLKGRKGVNAYMAGQCRRQGELKGIGVPVSPSRMRINDKSIVRLPLYFWGFCAIIFIKRIWDGWKTFF